MLLTYYCGVKAHFWTLPKQNKRSGLFTWGKGFMNLTNKYHLKKIVDCCLFLEWVQAVYSQVAPTLLALIRARRCHWRPSLRLGRCYRSSALKDLQLLWSSSVIIFPSWETSWVFHRITYISYFNWMESIWVQAHHPGTQMLSAFQPDLPSRIRCL